jgi:chemotaxis protein CheX
MDIELFNPFVGAVFHTMETMVGTSPERRAPYLKDDALALTHGDISAIVGFAGMEVSGAVILSFPEETAVGIYNTMMGDPVQGLTSEVQDLIGELANIVAGGAKLEFAKKGLSFNISIPSIVVGSNHAVYVKVDAPFLAVPFVWEQKPFVLEVSVKARGGR